MSTYRYRSARRGALKLFRHENTGEEMLFDLRADPGETTDLSQREPDVLAPAEKGSGLFRDYAVLSVASEPELAGALERDVRRAAGRFVNERTRRRPMIVPVVMEA